MPAYDDIGLGSLRRGFLDQVERRAMPDIGEMPLQEPAGGPAAGAMQQCKEVVIGLLPRSAPEFAVEPFELNAMHIDAVPAAIVAAPDIFERAQFRRERG